MKPQELKDAVKRADFTPGDIHIKATGKVAVNTDETTADVADLIFRIPHPEQTFLLVAPPPKHTSEASLLPKLREALNTGKTTFTISGKIHTHKDFPSGLIVEEFESAQKEG